jgi:predicted RNA-binding Zn-ribbon protein involved in translation (DUF1610 family)
MKTTTVTIHLVSFDCPECGEPQISNQTGDKYLHDYELLGPDGNIQKVWTCRNCGKQFALPKELFTPNVKL